MTQVFNTDDYVEEANTHYTFSVEQGNVAQDYEYQLSEELIDGNNTLYKVEYSFTDKELAQSFTQWMEVAGEEFAKENPLDNEDILNCKYTYNHVSGAMKIETT